MNYIREHYQLDYVGERYEDYADEQTLLPQYADLEDLIEGATMVIPGLRKEYREKYEQYSRRYYIEVDEYTTVEDVKHAHRMIRAGQKERSKTKRPKRDPLMAVQCAVLYKDHNEVNPEDGRQWRWTYQKLAEHFGLPSSRAAEDHVKLGKKILSGEDPTKFRQR